MILLARLLVSGLAVFLSAYLIPGVKVDSFVTALIVAVVLGLVNILIKPIISLLTLPLNLLTLGLFSFVINALMILLVAAIVKGFTVNGFVTALVFSIVLSVVSWLLNRLIK